MPTGVEGSWDSEEVVDGLRKLLSSQYGDAAARGLAGDLGVLRRARTDALLAAVGSAAEAAAAEDVLVRYCRLLQLLEKALGSDVRESRACRFEWRSCWEEKERRAHADVKWEQAGALYNLAAALCARAALPPLANVDAIKAAAHRFQLAAGAIALVEEMNPEAAFSDGAGCTSDLSAPALEALRRLALAQAQACFCEKAELDGLGAPLRTKLLAGAADDFRKASAAFASCGGRPNLKAIVTWGAATADARAAQYEAQARWLASEAAGEKGDYGAQIAHVNAASAAAHSAAAVPEGALKEKLDAVRALVDEAVPRLKKENDLVYYAKVPAEPPKIDGKRLAKPMPVTALLEAADDTELPGEEGAPLAAFLSSLAEFKRKEEPLPSSRRPPPPTRAAAVVAAAAVKVVAMATRAAAASSASSAVAAARARRRARSPRRAKGGRRARVTPPCSRARAANSPSSPGPRAAAAAAAAAAAGATTTPELAAAIAASLDDMESAGAGHAPPPPPPPPPECWRLGAERPAPRPLRLLRRRHRRAAAAVVWVRRERRRRASAAAVIRGGDGGADQGRGRRRGRSTPSDGLLARRGDGRAAKGRLRRRRGGQPAAVLRCSVTQIVDNTQAAQT